MRGLRREEVAELADVSVTWYTCFELGTAQRVSLDFVDRIASVLRLNPTEYTYLLALLGASNPPASAERREAFDAIVFGADTSAIAEVDGGLAILSRNETWHRLFGTGASHGLAVHANIVDCIFDDPDLREGVEGWDLLAGFVCGALRMQLARRHAEAAATFERYSRHILFSEQWLRRTLYDPQDADVRFSINHPAVGRIALRFLGVGLYGTANLLFVVVGDGDDAWRKMRSLPKTPA